MWEQTLLIVLGAGLLSLIALALAFKFFFRHLLKKLAEAYPQGQPTRIKVVPKTEEQTWSRESEVRKLCQDFEQIGFRGLGDMAFTPLDGILGVLMVHPNGYGAVVYDHPQMGVWADVIASHQERGGLIVTSVPLGPQLTVPPFSEKYYQPGATAAELWALFQEKLPGFPADKLFPLTRDTMIRRCESAYADETDWRNAQGGPSEQQVRSIAQQNPNHRKLSDEQVAQATELQRAFARSGLAQGLRQRLRDGMTSEEKLQFRSDELVIIHDQLTQDELLETLQAHIDDEEWEITDLPQACRNLPPRQAWQALQDLLPEVVRFEKVAELDFPLPTDAYKPPSGTIPIELFPHKRIQLEDPE